MKTALALGIALAAACFAGPLRAQDGPPLRFEVIVNGENFVVDEGRVSKLTSKQNPTKNYEIAVRLAPFQPWRLNRLQFDYHRGFAVTDNQAAENRTATLKHDLGFAIVLSEFDGPLNEAERKTAYADLLGAMRKSLEAGGAQKLEAGVPTTRKFGSIDGYGTAIKYQQGGVAEASLVYILTGPKVAASAVVQYLQADQADVLDLVRPTFGSLTPLAEVPAAP